jgi:protein TonB
MTPLRPVAITAGAGTRAPQLFQSLAMLASAPQAQRRGATLAASAALHSTLATALIVLPLLLGHALPTVVTDSIFDQTVLDIRVLPPPPGGGGPQNVKARHPRPQPQPQQSAAFTAPITTPDGVTPDKDSLEVDDCAACVRGGVPGLPKDAKWVGIVTVPEPQDDTTETKPTGAVRTGGLIAPPQLLRRVEPQYPELAKASRVSALVVLEAEVDARGRVQAVRIVSSHPLFDQASIDAVKQWRYQPLLLNGEPTAFIVTVNLAFHLQSR